MTQKEEVTLKDPMRPQGRVKIEVTDADTGELLDKVEKTNFISKGMDYWYLYQMKNLYQRGRATGGMPTESQADPFKYMLLTDADHDEDTENEWFMRGKVVGVANTTTKNAWGGDFGGQYNDVESFTRDDMVRIVIDFPASAANGTINSVYFYGGSFVGHHDFLFERVTDSMTKHLYHDGKIYALRYARDGGHGFGPKEYSELNVYDFNFNLLKTYTVTVSGASSASTVTSMAIRNDRIYFIGRSSGTSSAGACVWSILIDDLDGSYEGYLVSYPSYIKHIDITGGSAFPYGITYDPDKSRFVYTDRDNVRIYDKDFKILHSNAIHGHQDTNGQFSYDVHRYLYYHDGTYFLEAYTINPETGYVIPIGGGQTIKGFTPDGYVIGDISNTSSRTGYIQPKIGFSSRAKLSSPVNKTSANNMKVTYDFILPSTTPREDNF